MTLNTIYRELLPPLTTEEMDALRADIEINGVLTPIIIDEDNNILDGHHRYSIEPDAPRVVVDGLSESEKLAFVLSSNMKRRNLEIVQLREEGWTLQRIGDKYGVTRERVRQILHHEKEKAED